MVKVCVSKRADHLDPDRISNALQNGSREGGHIVTVAHRQIESALRRPVRVHPVGIERISDVVSDVLRYSADLTDPVARLYAPRITAEVRQSLRRERVNLRRGYAFPHVPDYEADPVIRPADLRLARPHPAQLSGVHH